MLALVRVASEINLKSGRVKARFLRALIRNMEVALESVGIKASFRDKWSRIFVEMSDPAGLAALARVFGVGSVSPIELQCAPDWDEILKTVSHYESAVADRTFRVRVKRAGVEGFKSHDLECAIGTALRPFAKRVDLKHAEFTLEVEVRPEGAFFYSQRIAGPGGLPLGVEGRALCLISGGFDSSVAAWMLMKRGVALDFVFFNLAGQHYERSVLCVVRALCQQWAYGDKPVLHVIDFNPMQQVIRREVRGSFAQVVLKRAMYRVATLLARDLNDVPALVTGEAMGQVSSQTLHNLTAIEGATDLPVLRPIIGLDKEEIIKLSRKIGTFVFSEHVNEYCAITLKHAVTRCRPERAAEEESRIPTEVFEAARASRRSIRVSKINDEDLVTQYLFTDHVPDAATVVDCRPERHYDAWHYPEAERWDADDVFSRFSQLEKGRTYVLYCPTGLQTAVIAEKMQKAGYAAYSFRGGTRALKAYCEREGMLS